MGKSSLVPGTVRLLATDYRCVFGSAEACSCSGSPLEAPSHACCAQPHLQLSHSWDSCGQPPARACIRQTPSQASWTWLLGWLRWGRGAVTAVLLWCGIPGQPRRTGVPVLARLPQFPGCASDLSWILGSRPVLPLLFIHPCSVFIVLNAPVGHQHLYTRDVPLSHGQAGRRGISDLKRKAQTTVKCDS